MVYKRYVKKNGKVHGPYYYESYRENGVVKKKYIGSELPKEAQKQVIPQFTTSFFLQILLVLLVIAVLIVIGFLSYLPIAKVTLDIQPTYTINEPLAGSLNVAIQPGDIIQKDTQIKLSLSKSGTTLAEKTETFEQFLGDQISYIQITNETLSCVNNTISQTREVCHNETTEETTREVCHDEEILNENNEPIIQQVCNNEIIPGTTQEVCTNEPISETTGENCTTTNSTDYYYNTTGTYSKPIESLISYNLDEVGDYVLTLSIPSLNVQDEETFSVTSAEKKVNQTIVIQKTKLKVSDAGGNVLGEDMEIFNNSRGKQDIKVKLSKGPIKSIRFNDVEGTDNLVKIDDIPREGVFSDYAAVYAIDPIGMNFSDAIVTVNAKGTELWKCKEWDFDNRVCNGEWIKLMDITPGEDYSFDLTPEDPAFAEYNYTTYPASQISGQKAYASADAGALPPASGPAVQNEAEFSSANYMGINLSDNIRASTSANNLYRVHRFVYNLTQSISYIVEINLTWEGYDTGSNTARRTVNLYAWNYTGNSWGSSLASGTSATDQVLNVILSSGLNNYVNSSGALTFIVESANTGGALDLYTDYTSMKVKYDSPPNATLVSPANGNITNVKNATFNCSAVDDYKLKNITFYWNYSGSFVPNGTVTVNGTYNSTTFLRTNLSNGAIKWNCYACDNISQCAFSPANWTVNVNYSASNVYLNSSYNITEPGNYLLTHNISSSGTSFIISANNVFFDCQGYEVTYGTSGTGIGINISGGDSELINVTVRNCNLTKGSSLNNSNYGIYMYKVNNSLINNSNITNYGIFGNNGIYLVNSSNNVVSSNNVMINSSSADYVINMDYGSNNSIIGNHLSPVPGPNFIGGVYFVFSTIPTIAGNTIITNGSGTEHGIYGSAYGANITSNTINAMGGSGVYISSFMAGGSRDIIANNVIFTTRIGINLGCPTANGISDYNLVVGNNVTVNSTYENALIVCGSHNLFISNRLGFVNSTANDWEISLQHHSSADAVNNTAINITLSTNNVTISFVATNTTSIRALQPTDAPSAPSGLLNISKYLSIMANSSLGAQLYLNISYADANISRIDEPSLRIWRHNGTDWTNSGFYTNSYGIDMINKVVYANITSFSTFGIFGSSSAPSINFAAPTPANGTNTTNSSVQINVSILNASDLNEVKSNWNGTNYSMYNDSLVLMMNFDNVSAFGENSTIVKDLSKWGNNGSVANTTWTSNGRYGGAYNFDGIQAYINLGTDPSLNPSSQVTVSAWVYSQSNIDINPIVSKFYLKVPGPLSLYQLNANNGRYTFYVAQSNNTQEVVYGNAMQTGKWVYLVGVANGTNLLIYQDGNLVNSSIYDGTIYQHSNPVLIGRESLDFGGYLFNGTIDEVRIWNRGLSAAEIKQQYYSNLNKYDNSSWGLYANESNLTVGTYSYFATAKDNSGNENLTETRWLNILQLRNLPIYANFSPSPETTNFSNFGDLTNVTGVVLATNFGKIQFPANYSLNANGENYDLNVIHGYRFISINTTGLNPSFNATANLTIYNITCPVGTIFYEDGFDLTRDPILNSNLDCEAAGICFNKICIGNNLTFTITHFTGFAVGNSSNMTIWDETDLNMPYGNQTRVPTNQTKFFANYTNLTDGISDATCLIFFNDTNGIMLWNSTSNLYEFNRTFDSPRIFGWNATCNKTGFDTLHANDTVIILDIVAPNGTIISPANNTFANATNVSFNISVSDIGGLRNATLYIYNQTGLYNISFFNLGGATNALVNSVVNLVAGVYSWFWEVFDLAGNLFSTSESLGNYTITIDTTKPMINFTAPTASSGSIAAVGVILVSVNVTDDNFASTTIYLYNSTGLVDSSISGDNPFYGSFSGVPQGLYFFNATAFDLAGNFNSTGTRNVTMPLEFTPQIESAIINSTYGTNLTEENLTCWVNGTDANGDNITYSGEWYRNGEVFVGEYWNRTFDGDAGRRDEFHGIGLDRYGNIYVAGITTNATNGVHYYTMKYDNDGNALWNRTLNRGSTDFALHIAVDPDGNSYVTGYTDAGATNDFFTVKYNSSGSQIWNVTYDSGSDDQALGIAVDANKNVYVTGGTGAAGAENYRTIKYNSTGGLVWNKVYNGGGEDYGEAVTVDNSGNVYVTGVSWLSGSYDYYTIKYNSTGDQKWAAQYDSVPTDNYNDSAEGIAVDRFGNVYVTGLAGDDGLHSGCRTIKYNSTGAQVLSIGYGVGSNAYGSSVALDSFGNIYVAGAGSLGMGYDYYTTKYNQTGNVLWNASYDGGYSSDRVMGIAVDTSGNIYVTGSTYDSSSENGYTIKYKDGFILANKTQGMVVNASLEGQFTEIGENWSCNTGAYDMLNYSSFMLSSNNLTILPPYFQISFVNPTPPNGTMTLNASMIINVSITNASYLGRFIKNWNGTNYTCGMKDWFGIGNYFCTNYEDNSLVLAFNFDNVSASGENATNAVDLSIYGNDGTLGNRTTTRPSWTQSGKYNRALSFDGANDFVTIRNDSSLNITKDITIELWFKTAGLVMNQPYWSLISKDNLTTPGVGLSDISYRLLIVNSTNSLYFDFANTSGDGFGIGAGVAVNDSLWHYAIGIRNDSEKSTKLYLDGQLVNSSTYLGEVISNDYPAQIGRSNYLGGTWYFNGTIDEVRIWNRTLSAAEIKQQYLSNLQKYDVDKWNFYVNESNLTIGNYTYFACATDYYGQENCTETRAILQEQIIPINVTLVSPSNYYLSDSRNVAFNCSASSISNLSNMTLYIWNFSGALINTSTVNLSGNFSYANFSYNFSSSGIFSWNCLASDVSGNSLFGLSNNTLFVIGNFTPGIQLLSPENNSVKVKNNISFIFYATGLVSGNLNCSLLLDNSSVGWYTLPQGRNVINYNVGDGSHTWNVLCIDNSSNFGAGQNLMFSVNTSITDSLSPTVGLVSPFNGRNFYSTSPLNITFVYNATDDYGDIFCTLYTNVSGIWQAYENHTNYVVAKDEFVSVTLNDISVGNYKWNVNCTDSSNNSAFAASNFTFNIIQPSPCTCGTCGDCTTSFNSLACSSVTQVADLSYNGNETCVSKSKVPGEGNRVFNGANYSIIGTGGTGTGMFVGGGGGMEIFLVMDTSGSMLDEDKLGSAKVAANAFVDAVGGNFSIGLVKFESAATLKQALTNNGTQLHNVIDNLTWDGGYTAVGEGINVSLSNFGGNKTKIIILLSDGLVNRGRSPISMAVQASKLNATIFTIAFGSDADTDLMENIAHITGGRYSFSPNNNTIKDTFLYILDNYLNVKNHTIANMTISSFKTGINLSIVSLSTINTAKIFNCSAAGINLLGGTSNIVINANMTNIRGEGIRSNENYTNITNIAINTTTSNGIYFYNAHDNYLQNILINNSGAIGIYLNNVSNSSLDSITVINATTGIYLNFSNSNNISRGAFTNSSTNYGVYLYSSNNNNLLSSTIRNNYMYGVYLYSSQNNLLNNNTVFGNDIGYSNYVVGIYLSSSSNNIINSTNISNAIYLTSSNSNNISNNFVNASTLPLGCGVFYPAGIKLISAQSNLITNNTANGFCFGIAADTFSTNTKMIGNRVNYNQWYGLALTSLGGGSGGGNANLILINNTATNNRQAGFSFNDFGTSAAVNLTGNVAINNSYYGFVFGLNTPYAILRNNTATNNTQYSYSFSSCTYTVHTSNDIDSSNVGGDDKALPFLFLFNMTNTHMVAANAQYSEVWLCQTTNATLNNVTISNSMYPSDGLVLDHAINNTVINSNFSYDYIGAWVNGWDGTSYYTGATDNYIANNVMSSESYGIKQESIRNTLAGNNISNCSWGIYFTGSYYGRSLFANNTIRYNTEGIYGSAGYANLVSNLIDRNMWGARGFGGNATYNVVSNNNNTGLSISGGNISNNIAYNNTLGITGGIIFVNNTVYNNTIGIQGAGASIFFNNATNNNHGILVRGYSYVSNNTVVNNVYGINATTDNTNNRIHNNLVVNNSYGISVGYSNNITNNTLISNGYGLSILGDSNNVYYNYFYNSTILHARAVQSNPFAAQANYFNTSSNASGIREAQGNYWDDIKKKGLDIIDTNYNIWADSGTQYPYNISNGGNVSTYVTDWGPIVDPLMVYASDIRCEVDGTTWIPCNNLAYDNNLTRVRVNCTDLNGGVVNATFNLTNVADSATKFYASNATEYQGALWIYDNPDLIIKDGGTWNIRAVCINALGQRQNNSANWTLPWGTLVPSIGIGNMNVIKNVPFTFNVSVQCSGGECGNINATADPEQQVWTPSNKSSNNMSASSICYFDMGCPGYRCPDSGFCYMDLPSCQSACGGSCPSPASGSRCGGASVHDTTFSPPWFDYNAGTCGGVYPNTGEYIKMTSGAFSGSCYSISSSSYPTCWGSYPCIQVSGSVSVSDCFDVYSSNCGAGGGGNPNATIVGNSSDVQTSGIANLNVTINGTKLNENITGVNLVAFFDGNTKLVDFNWNFTNSSILNMSSINITKTARGIYIQGVGVAKTIYANPGSVVEGICIKNADGVVANAKSCNGTGEKLVYSAGCNGTLVNVSGDWVNCTLNGTTYVLGGLSHSGGEPMSKGIIPMTSGTPFYTTTSNPYTCSAMYKGDSCAVSWTVMPTGDANTTWIFFAIANATQYLTISPAQTDTVNITILYDLIPPNITIIRPANGTITNMTAINFTAVLSDALSGLKNATLYIYNQTGLYNMSFFNLGGVANAIVSSIVNLAAGTYSWFWEVFDIVENMASTSVLYGNYTLRVDTSSPNYDNLSAMPASPTSYSYGQAYSFNATWTDDVDVDSVFIEFNGTVYTPNDLGSGIYNFGVVDLAAGNYSYRWSANDTAGNANYTDLLIYEIQKAATTTNVITQPTSPITYGTASNFSCYNSALLPMNLYVNGTNKTDEKGLSLTRAAGSYTVNCTSDDNENYTGGSEQINYLINRALQTAALVINETSPIAYDTYINATCNGEMFKNDANVTGEISSAVLLGAGSYNYSCKLYESENYSYDDDNMTFVVNQFAPNLTISILPSSSVTDGTITNVSGTGCPAQINCTLYMDGVNVSNPDVTMLAAGTYNYSYETPGNENYTIANVSAVLTVTTITPPGPGPGPTPCTEDSWTPSNSSICNGKSFTQTSNCGRIRTVTGISNGTDWTCGNWTACITNTQSRECISECSITRNESRACQCIPLWNCTEWSRCVNSTNARTCEDMNNCGIGQGRPNESESCGQQHGCAQNFICGEWSGCDYQNRVDDIINGKLTYEGIRHRVCADILSSCADNYTDYENCTSNETLELKKEEICGKEMLTAVNTKTGAPVTRIDIESWKSNRLDVAFIQKEVVYCPDCYNGLRDGSETGIDCGGNCRACKPESKLPIALLNWMLWILAAILVVPILKISRSDDDLLEQIKALIKSGEQALAKEDRKKAANNFREMKWLYVQIESKRKKRAILKAIQKYHRKIRSFYEL